MSKREAFSSNVTLHIRDNCLCLHVQRAARILARRFDDASAWAEKAYRDLPSFLMAVSVVAASHTLAGRIDEGRRAMDHLRKLDPTLRISGLKDWLSIRRAEDLAVFADGLRRAGLPE